MDNKPDEEEINQMNQDANVFAVLLLMPKESIEADLKTTQFDLADDGPLKDICKKYQVTMTAFSYRIQLLKLHGI